MYFCVAYLLIQNSWTMYTSQSHERWRFEFSCAVCRTEIRDMKNVLYTLKLCKNAQDTAAGSDWKGVGFNVLKNLIDLCYYYFHS